MNIKDIIERNILEERLGLLNVPNEAIGAVEKVFEDIKAGNTTDQAPNDIARIFGGSLKVNVIPWKEKGLCTPILITFCYDKDSFDGRIIESLDYAIINCPNMIEYIFFLTTQWDSGKVNKLAGYIESVRKNGVAISFIYLTPKGFVVMPV